MYKPATIKSISEALGVSLATVSRALQDSKSIRPETRQKVLDEARAQGYRRNLRGVNLRTGRSFTLGAILASNPSLEFGDPAMMHLIQGLINAAEGSEFKMVILPVSNEDEMFSTLRDSVESGQFEGVIIDHVLAQDERVSYLLDAQFPFVSFGRSDLSQDHPYFDVDNQHAAFLATQDLIKQGHQRIALLDGNLRYAFSQQRQRGYKEAMDAAGLDIDENLLHFGALRARNVREAMASLLKLETPPTGFVSANEVSTLTAVRACREQGQDMDKIGMVSRDGTRFFDYFQPDVNSCFHPIIESGERLTQMLMDAVRGQDLTSLQVLDQVELIRRGDA